MFLGMILGTLAVVLLVVFLVRESTRATQATGPTAGSAHIPPAAQAPPAQPPFDSPREILKRRYAAGEIDREDYLQRLSDL